MTTILAHRNIFYSDSRWSEEGAHFPVTKIKHIESKHGDFMMAGCGESRPINHLEVQLRKGVPLAELEPLPLLPGEEKALEFGALLIAPSLELFHIDQYFAYDLIHDITYAIGTGGTPALAAMHVMKALGHSPCPIRAVEAACYVDTYSAPPVQWMAYGSWHLHRELTR